LLPPAPRAGYIPGDGLRLRYYEWEANGSPAAPVVLLHGITGSAFDWRAVAVELSLRNRRVIAIDARGHGESEWSAEEAYAPDHHFADLATALSALGIQHCTVVGFSMGGAVATMFAGALPERSAGLVVVDAYPDPRMSAGSRRIAEVIASLYDDDATRLPGGFDPAIARRLRDDLAAGEARRLDLWPFWEAVSAPTLVVRGANSDVLTAEQAALMIERRPGARLVTVPNVGHQVPMQRPRELARAILELG